VITYTQHARGRKKAQFDFLIASTEKEAKGAGSRRLLFSLRRVYKKKGRTLCAENLLRLFLALSFLSPPSAGAKGTQTQ